MNHRAVPMGARKQIALAAHDNKECGCPGEHDTFVATEPTGNLSGLYDKRIPMRDGLELSVSGSYCGIYLHYAGKTQFVTAHTLYKLMEVSDPAYEQASEDL